MTWGWLPIATMVHQCPKPSARASAVGAGKLDWLPRYCKCLVAPGLFAAPGQAIYAFREISVALFTDPAFDKFIGRRKRLAHRIGELFAVAQHLHESVEAFAIAAIHHDTGQLQAY